MVVNFHSNLIFFSVLFSICFSAPPTLPFSSFYFLLPHPSLSLFLYLPAKSTYFIFLLGCLPWDVSIQELSPSSSLPLGSLPSPGLSPPLIIHLLSLGSFPHQFSWDRPPLVILSTSQPSSTPLPSPRRSPFLNSVSP